MVEIPVFRRSGRLAGMVKIDSSSMSKISGKRIQLGTGNYPEVSDGTRKLRLHSLILPHGGGTAVDHINGNVLDNRLCNLRLCTVTQNLQNRRAFKNSKTGLKGVSPAPRGGKGFVVYIQANKKHRYVGTFDTAEEAARAYDKMAKALHGEFARLNFQE